MLTAVKAACRACCTLCVRVCRWFRRYSAAIVAVATIVLATLTYEYLQETKGQRSAAEKAISLTEKATALTQESLQETRKQRALTEKAIALTQEGLLETRKQRALTEKAIALEHSPQVYIRNIDSRVEPSREGDELLIYSILVFLNCGRSEAKDLSFSYVAEQGGRELTRSEVKRYEHVYPGQARRFELRFFSISLSEKAKDAIRQAQERGSSNVNVDIPADSMEPVFLKVKFSYKDLEGRRVPREDRFKYAPSAGRWEWTIPAETASEQPQN